jgi:flagellar biosynthetic protein FliO
MGERTHMKTVAISIALCIMILVGTPQLKAEPSADIGGFDINKVASAVAGQNNQFMPETGKVAASVQKFAGKKEENWLFVCMRIGFYLAITILAIFLLIFGIKKAGFATRSKIGGGSMDVLEALPLGQHKSVALVRIVDKVYVIGQTQTGMNVLDTIEGQKALELISTTKGVVSMMQFKEVFNSFMGKFKK